MRNPACLMQTRKSEEVRSQESQRKTRKRTRTRIAEESSGSGVISRMCGDLLFGAPPKSPSEALPQDEL